MSPSAVPDSLIRSAIAHRAAARHEQARAVLWRALRRGETDYRALHALGLMSCLAASQLEDDAAAARHCRDAVAVLGRLFADDGFWGAFRAEAEKRYQTAVSPDTMQTAREQLEEHLLALLRPRRGRGGRTVLWQREVRAAALLRELAAASEQPALVGGPLLLRRLRRARQLGEFVRDVDLAAVTDDLKNSLAAALFEGASAGAARHGNAHRLRRYFSALGTAQVLMELSRPEQALRALAVAACKACRPPSSRRRSWQPVLCAESCPAFDKRNPAYGALTQKGQRLRQDACDLAAEAHLAAAEAALTGKRMHVPTAVRHWQDAKRLTAKPARQPVYAQIVETALGRSQALLKQGRLDEAVALLEGATSICRAHELVARMGEALTERGCRAANETPPRFVEAVEDLRQAVTYNQHSPRAAVSLSRALRNWAGARAMAGDDESSISPLFREAHEVVEEALGRFRNHEELMAEAKELRHTLFGDVGAFEEKPDDGVQGGSAFDWDEDEDED